MFDKAVFISYRRKDAATSARGLYVVLRSLLGEKALFFDQADLQPGDPFPDYLRQAIHAAPVMLVVMGGSWVNELNARLPRAPAEVDVVRDEVRLALELREQAPDTRFVIPVLMESDVVPSELDLAAPLRLELASLFKLDFCKLGGKQSLWDLSVRELYQTIRGKLAQQPAVLDSDIRRLESARARMVDCLNDPLLEPLRTTWGQDPLKDARLADLERVLTAFAKAVRQAHDAWRQRRLGDADVADAKQKCRDLLADLCLLAVDGAAARAWFEGSGTQGAVPVASIAALAMAYALAQGKRPVIASGMASAWEVGMENVIDLGEADAGAGERRRHQAQKACWELSRIDPTSEFEGKQGTLSVDGLRKLQGRLRLHAEIQDCVVLLTERQPTPGMVTDLPDIGRELGLAVAPRTGIDGGLLRVLDEETLNELTAQCLKQIQGIR